MKRESLPAKLIKTTSLRIALSTTLLINLSLFSSAAAQAQAIDTDQYSLLPPEVVPINAAAATSMSSQLPASNAAFQTIAPGMVSNQGSLMPASSNGMQSAKDFRKAMMESLAGKGNYPQFNNPAGSQNSFGNDANQIEQPSTQASNPANQSNQGNAANPIAGQSDWLTADQNNIAANAAPAQTQTLSGGVRTSPVPSQGGSKLSHSLGLGTSLGASAFALGSSHGAGSYYSLGMLGATLLNFGAHSGFRF